MPINRYIKIEKLKQMLDPARRFVDMGARLRVWRRGPDGEPAPGELIPRVYGGVYDRITRRYIASPTNIRDIACHEGQLPLLTFDDPKILRVLALGAPGGGKTFAAIRRALLNALDMPNSIGGLIAPTGPRKQVVWRDFLELVEPFGWVDSVVKYRGEIILANGAVIQVKAAKSSGQDIGNPLQGLSFSWCVVDESQNIDPEGHIEIATRGRRAGKSYRIYETATNAQVPSFRVRLEQFKTNPQYKVLRFSGQQNPWVDLQWWERLKGDMSERDYREKILAEDLPPEMVVYNEFKFSEHITPRPRTLRDITAVVGQAFNRQNVKWIIGQDFGVLITCSIIFKCYQGPNGEKLWWACDEITSGAGVTADIHARKILSRYDAEELLIVADPHFNTKESDKSDYHLFEREGLFIVPAVYGQITKKSRITMLNGLLRDKRFFVDCDKNKQPACTKLIQSFMVSQYDEMGRAEMERKNYRDPSHWPAAAAYGLFPWERIQSTQTVQFIKSKSKQTVIG